jgi:serine/threonine protein kinase
MPAPSSLQHALPPGHRLGHYSIDKTIGGGGFSVVYEAMDNNNNKKVVIKEFLPLDQVRRREDASVEYVSQDSNQSAAAGIRRFFNEAAALAKVNHPYIVKVRDVFRANNTVYMVMDHHKGHDLRWYVKRNSGRLSEHFILTVFPKLLGGLGELHSNDLLHLDIKPANVYIRSGGRPLLLDFGAARQPLISRLRSGPNTLTMGYAPLEQHRNGHIGPWTDLYAIGATIYACMAGKPPPGSPGRAERDTLKPAVRQFAGRYSRRLLDAVDWCLHMDQTQRPQNVPALMDFLAEDWIEEEEPGLWQKLTGRLPWTRLQR